MFHSSLVLCTALLAGYMVMSGIWLNDLPKRAGFSKRSLRNHDNSSSSSSQREDRFPSVEERVKLYMSNWYVPPCPQHEDGHIRYEYDTSKDGTEWPIAKVYGYTRFNYGIKETAVVEVENIVVTDKAFLLNDAIINNCAIPLRNLHKTTVMDTKTLQLAERVKKRSHSHGYCQDIKDSFLTAWNHEESEDLIMSGNEDTLPVLLQFGDDKRTINFPVIKKFRSAFTEPLDLVRVTSQECYSTPREPMNTVHHKNYFQPIIWKLNSNRHYGKLNEVYTNDTAWGRKKDVAIFRGALTGQGYSRTSSDDENCQQLKRCQLVYEHANSTIIDAKLTNARGLVPDVLHGVPLVSEKIDVSDMMNYKGLIMIEGNDVASGLKWALLSQSVVLMAPPKHTSWAMEELLEPWVVSTTIPLHSPFCYMFQHGATYT